MEEEDINLVNFMKPKQAYEKFENELLELLPSDQQEFIAQLEEKGVIDVEDREKMNVTNHSDHKAFCTAVILEKIEGSLTDSDEKFYALLDVMEEYKNGLDSLALKIKNHLDPIGTPFVCETMREYLSRNSSSLSNLPYNKMKHQLLAKKIITSHEKQQIGFGRDEKSQMEEVIRIIGSSLFSKQTRKFKQFLELMEASGNQLLVRTAQKLGGSKRVPDIGEATSFKINLIPVGHSELKCDGRIGGSYLWKGHDFGITLPPYFADGTVNISIGAYLPGSTQSHCLASAVFEITTDVEQFKKAVTLSFPHWVNIKSETDKEKLQFLIFQRGSSYRISYGLSKGSFEVGESLGSIEVSKVVLLICICKKFPAASFAFSKAEYFHFHTDQILKSYEMVFQTPQALVNFEEGYPTETTDEETEDKYLDLLVLPTDGHDEKWGMYCIALDNPTYLQAFMKYFIDKNQVNSGIQILKRQVVFESAADDAVANLCIGDTDAKIIAHSKKISKLKVDSLDLRALKYEPLVSQTGDIRIVEKHEINFPMWCSLNIIRKLSPSSSKLKVDGLCGVRGESSEFSLASPTEYGYKFETYEHVVESGIIENPLQPEDLIVHNDGITETTITLSWKEPKPSNVPDPSDVPITGYEVQYRKSGEEFKKLEKSLTHEDLTCEVTDLVSHTEYQFKVAAINAAGRGPFTDVVTQFTKPSQLKELSVLKDRITETTITLSWKESNPSDVPITEYEVQYRKGGEKFKIKKVKKSLTHEDLTCEVTGLVANTEYQFRVAAINGAGHGPFTDVVTQFTSFDYIGTAKHLKRQLGTLSKLNYDNMKTSLYANEVITTKEKNIIGSKIGCEKMEYLIEEIIIPSLEQRHGKKYKSFLKAMEDSEDTDLQDTAKMLGGSERVPADTTRNELSPKTGDKRKRSTSESDAKPSTKPRSERSNANEKVFSNNDGRSYIDESVREEKKKAVCIVYTPGGAGTGFIGKIDLYEEDSVVLVTNYHVIIGGLPEWYENAIKVSEGMKKNVIENARRSEIMVEGKKIKLSGGILVEGSCKMSSAKSLDYFIIKLDEAELEKKLSNGVPTINLNCPADVNDNDQISIFQHPRVGQISSSSSTCGIAESRKGDRARLMVYRCGTDPGSSGGPILKVVNKDLVIVGLHRGGLEDNWDTKGSRGYNYGTHFSDIIKSIQEDWYPTVLDYEDENDKKDIHRVVNSLT